MTSRSRLLASVVCVLALRSFALAAELSEGAKGPAPIAPAAILGMDLAAPLGPQNLAPLKDVPASLSLDEALALTAARSASAGQTAYAQATAQAPQTATAKRAAGAAKSGPAPQAIREDAEVRGKTLLMVGTRGSRPFIIEEAVRVADALGLNLILLDKEENRKNSEALVPAENFVAAPIDKRDDKSLKAVVDRVQALKASRPIDYVMAFRSHHAKLVGKIVDATGIAGVPSRVTLTAEDKVKTRKALNVDPAQHVAYKEVKTEAEVRDFWRQNAAVPGAKFVMKSKLGENSRFVELDIDTEEKLVSAFAKMDAALRAEAKKKESSDTIFNRYPGIMVERMLEKAPGTVEASVEMVVQDGKVKFAMVSDTHGIGKNGELAGGSMTFPSQMAPQIQEALVAASARALEIVGLTHGNARIDIMMTPEGPKVIEINPFLGGAAIHEAVRLVSGISLVEWGIRAMLGLTLPQMPAFTTIVDYRFAASQLNGDVVSVDGVAEAKATPGVAHVQVLEGPGDSVAAPIENGFEEWAEVMGTGSTFEEAKRRSIEALAKLKAKVIALMSGDYLQPRASDSTFQSRRP